VDSPSARKQAAASTRAPELIQTARLDLRRPQASDAEEMFATYTADPEVTRYVGFPRHRRIEDTRAFLAFSDGQWSTWPAGPYLIRLRADGSLLGSSGLMFETPCRAATGYVLARGAWGRGYATEAVTAMIDVARGCGVRRLYAVCHHEHLASAHVLEKAGFALEGTLRRYAEFPNLAPGEPLDCRCYARIFDPGPRANF
jgi:RimJ/RimL family protein N-acetyltransferase